MIDGFFDVESRGAFQAFQAAARRRRAPGRGRRPRRRPGEHGRRRRRERRWFDRYVRGVRNGVGQHPRVQLWLADGDREDMLAGDFVRFDGRNWPVPGTRWSSLALDPAERDRELAQRRHAHPRRARSDRAQQSYPALASIPFNSDPYNTAIIGGFGVNQLATAFPVLTEMGARSRSASPTRPRRLSEDVLAAGPASLDLRLSSTAPETAIWAVLSDVSPDGVAHPVASGRLFDRVPADRPQPLIAPQRRDRPALRRVRLQGTGRARAPSAATGSSSGRRQSLRGRRPPAPHVLAASGASEPGVPAVDTVTVGAGSGSRLRFPVLPGSDLASRAEVRRR